MQHLTHWDDVEPRRREAGHAAGTRRVGVMGRIEPLGSWDGEP